MTSGDGARVAYPLFQVGEGGSIPTPTLQDSPRIAYPLFHIESNTLPTSPLQFEICEITTKRAQALNMQWHSRLPIYRTGFLLTSKVCFGALYKGVFYAVAIWGNPVARMLPQKEWMELKRFAISDEAPKNTASRMMSIMTKLITKSFPGITRLISYQDVEAHHGTIYKASGWVIGKHHGGGYWSHRNSIDPNTGKKRDRPDLNEAIGPKIRWEKDLQNPKRNRNQS